MLTSRPLLALLLSLGALAASPARAQPRAALMPTVAGHREIADDTRDAARRAALELLHTEDLSVLTPEEVIEVLNEVERQCAPGAACASSLRLLLDIDLLVGLTIWGSPDDPSTPETVHASILGDEDARYVGSASVEHGVATAVHDALRAALRDQRRGPGPFLQVGGTRGATCELDGAAVGTIPLTVRVEPGEHELLVHQHGFEPQTVSVTIGSDITHTTEVEVTLQPAGAAAPPPSEPSVLNWVIGVAGLSGGLALALPAIVNLGLDGQCADGGTSGCRSVYAFDPARDGAMLVIGGALLAVGVVFLAAQPIRVSASASPDGAHLQLEGTF